MSDVGILVILVNTETISDELHELFNNTLDLTSVNPYRTNALIQERISLTTFYYNFLTLKWS